MKSKKMIFLAIIVSGLLITGCTQTMQAGSGTAVQQTEKNKEIVKMFVEEVWSGHDIAAADKYVAENVMRHSYASYPPMNEIKGRKMYKGFAKVTFAIFPDWHEDIQFMVAEGDRVMYISKASATQAGKMGPLPALNKKFVMHCIAAARLEGGKIVEVWSEWDNMAMYKQLGFKIKIEPDL